MAPTMFLETAHSLALAKRGDDNILGVPKWLLVFIIMIASGVVVIMCYGIFRFMTPEKREVPPIPAAQADYMREVRDRNLNGLMAELSHHRGAHGYRQSNRR